MKYTGMGSTSITPDHLSFSQPSSSSLTPNTIKSTLCYPKLSRSVSTTSTGSMLSSNTSSTGRESLGSTTSYSDSSVLQSPISSSKIGGRQSLGASEKPFRRGFVRPQGTNFAASARSRESVLSLGSIAHLQYYFARTGLLDGRGGRRARKKPEKDNLDFLTSDISIFSIDTTLDTESSCISAGSPPGSPLSRGRMSSPFLDENEDENEDEEYFYCSEDDEELKNMLPPTVSTYNHREKYIPRLPTLKELKDELEKTLLEANTVLDELKPDSVSTPESPSHQESNTAVIHEKSNNNHQNWYEIQGLRVLDVMTLAIRAAKMYYTAHDQPERLAAIKSEREIRTDLLSVMEVLRNMAIRNFDLGVKKDERKSMERWVASVYEILHREEILIEEERSQCATWTWLDDNWSGSIAEREWAFMKSMDPDSNNLPPFRSVDDLKDDELPSEFLADLMTGLRLVKIHNAVVRKSKRPFGAISRWHTDFRKPYRCTENLLFWIKAAELRFEVLLDVDVTSIVHGTNRKAWKDFEVAILTWCGTARREITMGLNT
ncbi:hypothetical protein OnM2_058051 [Erysiphe neolycopersici]|uniref:Uncharacterized protein n=1 Tax=Erysiphe neolycopersici TaxID=212602 RepID=A0A420HQJ6_9PEZI|nr:hypothetical protein OnM2_058051 [Erysiphe neolycopersici]